MGNTFQEPINVLNQGIGILKPIILFWRFAVLVLLLTSVSTVAQAKTWPGREERVLGLGIKSTFPFSEFGNKTDNGWGVAGLVDYPLIPFIDLTADLGVTHFSGKNGGESVNVWNASFGGRFALGVFFMGGETGYFSYVEEWSFIPSMGLRFGSFEGSIGHKSVGGGNWTSLRFGYYF